jgi:hypothetical protein
MPIYALFLFVLAAEYTIHFETRWNEQYFVGPHSFNIDSICYARWARAFPYGGYAVLRGRPLYAFMAKVLSYPFGFLSPEDIFRFLVNPPLLLLSVIFLYEFSLYLLGNRLEATAAALLLATSLAFNIWGGQPVPEILGYFSVIASTYLLFRLDILGEKSTRLAIGGYGSLVGLLLLGKENYAILLFILFMGMRRKKIPRALSVIGIAIIPTLIWMVVAGLVYKGGYHLSGVKKYSFVVWIFRDLLQQPAGGQLTVLLDFADRFIKSLMGAYGYLALLFSIVGIVLETDTEKRELCLLFFLPYPIMFFAMNLMRPRLLFLTFPFVLPYAVRGIFQTASLLAAPFPARVRTPIRLAAALLLHIPILVICNINIYNYYYYG